MTKQELKPCPFCGSEVQDDERGEKYPKKSPMGGWIIHCECCGASLSQFRKSGKDEISWNTRPIEDELNKRIAELKELAEGHDPFEDFPPKERGCDCSVIVLGKFEYEEEFTPFTNWDLCVYWFDEEKWHPLNGYVEGDDIVRWYALPPEVK